MADMSKLAARRKGFGEPPSLDEASENLLAPEVAPAAPADQAPTPIALVPPAREEDVASAPTGQSAPSPVATAAEPKAITTAQAPAAATRAPGPPKPAAIAPAEPARAAAPRIDGRALRRTGRTVALATRVSESFDSRLRSIAQREGLLLCEVLEQALEAYEQRQG